MYERILVPVDGGAPSDRGVAEALRLARLTGGRVLFLHAVDFSAVSLAPEAALSAPLYQAMRDAGTQLLAAAQKSAQAAGIPAETRLTEAIGVRIGERVVDEADKWHADLIVIGTHGRRGIGRLLLGSDAETVVRFASVPVLLVRGGAAEPDRPA